MPDSRAFWSQQRVLILAPHADDETFGCGGLISKVKAAGGSVYVMVGSVGDLHHYGAETETTHGGEAVAVAAARRDAADGATDGLRVETGPKMALVTGAQRADELAQAMAMLHVDGFEVLFSDPRMHLRLDTLPTRDLIALIERDARYAVDRVAPTALVLPAPSYNQDHDALFKAGFAACRPHLPKDRPFISLVLSCEAPQLGWHHESFHPNFYVDITGHLETKLRAHACHRSQVKPAPHHASLENVERLARLRGAEISVEAAEAFQCYRILF